MWIAFAIDAAEDDSFSIRLRIRGPDADLCQHRFHLRFTELIFGIPPVECAQRFIERIVRLLSLRDQTQRQPMHEPSLRACVAWRVDRFLAPLQHTLRLREGAFLFCVTRGW